MTERWEAVRGSRALFWALIALATVVRVGVVLHRGLDPDESQHLHAAWLVAQGQVPSLHFWEHHTPLLYYLLAPLTRCLADDPAVYLAARGLMAVLATVAVVLVYRLAARLSRGAAMAAVVLLAFLPQFGENSTEVRPDVPALVAWLTTLLALVRWAEGRGSAGLWVAGLGQGLAVTLTLKAVYGALGVAVAVGLLAYREGRARGAARALSSISAGTALPAVALVTWLWQVGGWPALASVGHQVIWQNLRFVDFMKTWPVRRDEAGFAVLALVGMAVALRGPGAVQEPLHTALLVPSTVVGALLVFPRTPAVYQHAWLPVIATTAVYAGLGLTTLLERTGPRGRAAIGALAVAGGLLLPVGVSVRDALHDQTSPQFQVMRWLLRHACAGEPVLDGTALAVFRPAAYRYGVLTTGVREWIARGAIPEEQIEEDIRQSRPRVGYADSRLRALIGPVATLIDRHYVRAPDGFLVAGARIEVSGRAEGGRAYVALLVSGAFRVMVDPGIEVAVNGAAVRPGFLRLEAGRHEVTWTGPRGRIELVAATCPERRALDLDASPDANRLTSP